LVVRETAGIRRFSYPVSTLLSLPRPPQDTDRFRLLEMGNPVPAQFLPVANPVGGHRSVSLDFLASPAPYEAREYTVEYGPDVEPVKPARGMRVESTPTEFHVVHSPALQFILPRDLLGLLHQVQTPRLSYLRPGSAGLTLWARDGGTYRVGGPGSGGGPMRSRITKAGPLASTLRYEGEVPLRNGPSVASVVELEFPLSKSWAEVRWTIHDPQDVVAGLGAELNLLLEGEPALVDFGADTLVYAALRKGQEAVLRAGLGVKPPWQVLVGPAGAAAPFVVGPPSPRPPAVEGWAHVMDRQRCTALAVADFAAAGKAGEIAVDATGRLQIGSRFPAGSGKVPGGSKALRFWLHFVDMPVHVGAATSPQAMRAPLRVEVSGKAPE
jgi:hypothetical protein